MLFMHTIGKVRMSVRILMQCAFSTVSLTSAAYSLLARPSRSAGRRQLASGANRLAQPGGRVAPAHSRDTAAVNTLADSLNRMDSIMRLQEQIRAARLASEAAVAASD